MCLLLKLYVGKLAHSLELHLRHRTRHNILESFLNRLTLMRYESVCDDTNNKVFSSSLTTTFIGFKVVSNDKLDRYVVVFMLYLTSNTLEVVMIL